MFEINTNRLKETLEKFKIPIALSLVGLVLIIGGIVSSGFTSPKLNNYPKESIMSGQKDISVDVSGAVVKVGVYKLTEGSRVEDAIKAAGGLAEKANIEYISKYINMAQKLSDGTKVYVPLVGDNPPTGGTNQGAVSGTSAIGLVNINSASQKELEALPGIGPVTAAKIISGRPYQKIEDLLSQKIVSKSTFEKIKDQISLY